ncbi:MAG: hypothetical protein ABI462_09425 [Ignavibacteria bacterium]
MVRSVLAVLAGLVTAFVVIFVVEAVGHIFYPPPPDADLRNPETIKLLMENAPTGSLIMLLIGWAAGSFIGGLFTAIVATKNKVTHSIITGGLLMISGISNMVLVQHPVWMWIFGLMMFVPFAYLGSKYLSKNRMEE